jgi:exodeoxyribonuclease-5
MQTQNQLEAGDLSEDQARAFQTLTEWVNRAVGHKRVDQLSLGGYAGTGKTTLLRLLIDEIDPYPQVMSLTGKAVSVLIKKTIPAQTIHSTIYHVEIEKKKPVFYLRDRLEDHADLFIIDEASMVSTALYKDLLTFGIPILWVGDHGQLEPIGQNPGVMKCPDVRLEKIHRQAAGNPIIMFADKVRRGAVPEAIASKEHKEIEFTRKTRVDDDDFLRVDQVIVALNRTRVKINKHYRHKMGFPADRLQPGDRVVCLKNNRKEGIFNGLQGKVVNCSLNKDWPVYWAIVELENGRIWEGEMLAEQFNKVKGLVEPDKAIWKASFWDYAYAITCHKAQGSVWPAVLVMEEPSYGLWSVARWRYTAVTRASEKLIYAS